jgi:hypothetical protein
MQINRTRPFLPTQGFWPGFFGLETVGASPSSLHRFAIAAKIRIALAPSFTHNPPMLARVLSAAVNGIEAFPVEVEVNCGWGDTIIVIIATDRPHHKTPIFQGFYCVRSAIWTHRLKLANRSVHYKMWAIRSTQGNIAKIAPHRALNHTRVESGQRKR